jgi:extradiol dioxygenase family protein
VDGLGDILRPVRRKCLVIEEAKVSYEGAPTEQGKIMITDPSGNLIEIKAYRHPSQVLGPLADA